MPEMAYELLRFVVKFSKVGSGSCKLCPMRAWVIELLGHILGGPTRQPTDMELFGEVLQSCVSEIERHVSLRDDLDFNFLMDVFLVSEVAVACERFSARTGGAMPRSPEEIRQLVGPACRSAVVKWGRWKRANRR